MKGYESPVSPEDIIVDSFRHEAARNGERLRSTDLYMCVCFALYDEESGFGDMIHDMIKDDTLEGKIRGFLAETGDSISDIVITGGAHAKNYDEKLDAAIEDNIEHVRQVVGKLSDRARVFDHQSSDDTKTVLIMDTRNRRFEILIGPDERNKKQLDFVRRKLVIKDGQEEWQFFE